VTSYCKEDKIEVTFVKKKIEVTLWIVRPTRSSLSQWLQRCK